MWLACIQNVMQASMLRLGETHAACIKVHGMHGCKNKEVIRFMPEAHACSMEAVCGHLKTL